MIGVHAGLISFSTLKMAFRFVQKALDDNQLNDLIKVDDGFRCLSNVRSSPAHWVKEKKKVLSMVRQFGLPIFFMTLSAAEKKWPELLVILPKTVDGIDIT